MGEDAKDYKYAQNQPGLMLAQAIYPVRHNRCPVTTVILLQVSSRHTSVRMRNVPEQSSADQTFAGLQGIEASWPPPSPPTQRNMLVCMILALISTSSTWHAGP